MASERKLIFLHIPKTAGSTLRMVVKRQFSSGQTYGVPGGRKSLEAVRDMPEDEKRMIRLFEGHMPFGLHRYIDGPVDYITMLREPVDRMISLYYFVRRSPDNRDHREIVSNNMSLHDYVERGAELRVANHQTRILSGLFVPPSAESLEVAKDNLSTYFSAFGIMERFDESLIFFKRLLGWRNIYYYRENVTRDRPPKREIPPATLKLIEERNALDIELYDFAQRKFDELLSRHVPSVRDEVGAFRSANRIYGQFLKGYDMARRVTPRRFKDAIERRIRAA